MDSFYKFFAYVCISIQLLFTSCQYEPSTDVSADTKTTLDWPSGKEAAISLTFDDARFSQVDSGLQLLDQYEVRGSFYVSVWSCSQRLEGWMQAIEKGHEIGNHSNKHPCTGSYGRELELSLEQYDLKSIKLDILLANKRIEELLGTTPSTFAYPCGQQFVGSGKTARSYIPIIAEHFLAGRNYGDEGPNDPTRCDLANILGVSMDNKSFEDLLPVLEEAKEKGFWLVLVGHDVGREGILTTRIETLHQLIQYASGSNFWIAPVRDVAAHLHQKNN